DQVDHVVGRGSILRHDLAAGLRGELVRPGLVRVAGLDDEIDLPLRPGLGLDLGQRRAEALHLRARALRASTATAAARGGDGESAGEERTRAPAHEAIEL